MADVYVSYPQTGGSSTVTGSVTGAVYVVGTIDTAAPSADGAVIGSSSLYMQSASATNPGLANTTTQTFAGVKTFNSAPVMAALTASAPVLTNGSKALVSGSISLTNDVTGNLPLAQTSGSISLVNQVVGNLPILQTSGSVSLTNKVSGILPAANLPPLSGVTGSVSLTGQVSGILPIIFGGTNSLDALNNNRFIISSGGGIRESAALTVSAPVRTNANGLPTTGSTSLATDVTGQITLTTQVTGILPVLNGGTGKADSTIVIGSITHSQTAAGATYAVAWPAAQGGSNTVPKNDGSGNLTWSGVVTNPTTSITIGSVTVQQVAGGATYTTSLPSAQGSSTASILTNNGAGTLTWVYNVDVSCRYVSCTSPVAGSTGSISYNTVKYDTHSAYSTSTGLFTAPADGKYQVNAAVIIAFSSSATDNAVGIVIRKNGADYSQVTVDTVVLQTQQNAWISDIVVCSAGHTIGISALATTTNPTFGNSATQNFLSIQKLSNR